MLYPPITKATFRFSKGNKWQGKDVPVLMNPSKLIISLNKETKITPADRKNFLGLVGALSDNEIKKLLYEVLTPIGYNLMVTPKEVDFILSKLSDVISYGINHSIHSI